MAGHTNTAIRDVRGIVFDLQRFALSDGPGIRTTVFLKGCALSCVWCHNPESQSFRFQLSYDEERCTQCLECADVCPTGALTVRDGQLAVEHDLCNACGACVSACPEGAFTIIGKETTAGEIIDEVVRDKEYFDRSGGGLTLSGGEPLAQPDFALALLRLAKERGLHTCLDTSGAIDPRRLQRVLPYVDLFLFDYKASGSELHRDLTGVSNDLIRENLEYLYSKDAKIVLRCPLVPGINDDHRHLQAIADLGRRFPRLRGLEIMPYHNMGREKARHIGFSNPLVDLPSADESDHAHWLNTLHAMGCTRAVIG